MPLTIYQKSLYLIIYNATMISRSISKTFREKTIVKEKNKTKIKKKVDKKVENKRRKFRISVFNEIEKLTNKMDNKTLKEQDIWKSIKELSEKYKISIGQAQKPINVILKYHFFASKNKSKKIKSALHCPIDSRNLEELNRSGISLTKINKEKYSEIQCKINKDNEYETRIDLDVNWDKTHLKRRGLL